LNIKKCKKIPESIKADLSYQDKAVAKLLKVKVSDIRKYYEGGKIPLSNLVDWILKGLSVVLNSSEPQRFDIIKHLMYFSGINL